MRFQQAFSSNLPPSAAACNAWSSYVTADIDPDTRYGNSSFQLSGDVSLRNHTPELAATHFRIQHFSFGRHGLGWGWQYAVLSRRCTAALWRHQTRGHALSFALESLVMSRVWMQRLSRATHPSSIVPRVFWTRTPSKWCFSRVTCGCATARGTLGGSWRATRSSSAPRVCEAGHAHLLHLPRLPCSRLPVPIRHHHYCCHPPQIPARAWRNGLDRPSSAVSDT